MRACLTTTPYYNLLITSGVGVGVVRPNSIYMEIGSGCTLYVSEAWPQAIRTFVFINMNRGSINRVVVIGWVGINTYTGACGTQNLYVADDAMSVSMRPLSHGTAHGPLETNQIKLETVRGIFQEIW